MAVLMNHLRPVPHTQHRHHRCMEDNPQLEVEEAMIHATHHQTQCRRQIPHIGVTNNSTVIQEAILILLH
jgi:hypothetical protein